MRVRIIFNLNNKGAYVPFHHQYLLSEVVEKVKAGLPEPYTNYHLHNFSGLKGQTKVGKNGLHFFSNKVTVVFSAMHKEFVDLFLRQLFANEFIVVGGLSLCPDRVEIENLPKMDEAMKYLCLSPIIPIGAAGTIDQKRDFISPYEDQFSDLLYESTLNRMEATGLYTSEEIAGFFKFQVVPDQEYLAKVQHDEKKYSRIYLIQTQVTKTEYRGYTLPFSLYADPKVQDFIFNCGLGEFTDGGFGMLDIANSNPIGRSEPYPLD